MAIIRDGDWILQSSDIRRGRYTWRRDNGDGTSTIRTDTMCDPVIDQNTAQRNLAKKGFGGDWHHVAAISAPVFWGELGEAARQNDEAYITKWLNNSDNRAWRTKDGVL